MKNELRYAALSAAAVAALYGTSAQARNLIWDPGLTATAAGSDGSGNWDTTTPIWVDTALPGAETTFSNAIPDSVRFGTNTTSTATAVPYQILLNANITVQNITLASSAGGANYNIFDQGDGLQTLTLNGNIFKASAVGSPQFGLTNAMVLSAGNHIIAVRDSPGDTAPELQFNSALTGSGSLTIDNTVNYGGAAADIQYGTTLLNTDNTYSGGTTVQSGRLLANTNGSLGSGAVTISSAGALAFGGGGTAVGDRNYANPITITRSDYSTANTNNRYTAAVIASNDGSALGGGFSTITLSGPITVDSTDARVRAETNRIIVTQPLVIGPTTGTNSVFTADGDFAGFVQLTADNTPYGTAGGAIRIINGVELEANTEAQLGGATSKLLLAGGSIHPTGALATGAFMTNFGSHNLTSGTTATPINTGVNVDSGNTFTINNLSGTAIGKRGTGTFVFSGTNTFTGVPFFDAGAVNFTAGSSTSFGAFRIRSATFTIPATASVSTTGSFTDIGSDSPDNGTVNLSGTLTAGNFDFNISDNTGTQGTLNVQNAATFTSAGRVFAGKALNTVATITQSGTSTVNITSTGAPALGLGTANGSTGTYTKTSTGSLSVGGETWVGNAQGGVGTFSQSVGSTTVNNWLAVGRGGATGTLNVTGGTFTKQGGNNAYVGESINTVTSTMTLSNAAQYIGSTGEFWVGQGGGSGLLTIQDTASFSNSNWIALARANANSRGIVNFTGGTFTKTAGSGGYLAIGSGGVPFTPTGGSQQDAAVFNQTGATTVLNVYGARIGEASSGTMNITAGTSTFTGEFSLGYAAGILGTLNIGGTANVVIPNAVFGVNATTTTAGGQLNLNGGTLTAASITGGASNFGTTLRNLNFNGGTLKPAATNTTNFIGAKITGVVRGGGAKVDTAGFDANIAGPLIHDTALGATADGGLAKTGVGTLILTGANTYTGATSVTGGTLTVANATATTNILNASGGGVTLGTAGGRLLLDYTGGTSPAATVAGLLAPRYNATSPGSSANFTTGTVRSSAALPGGRTIGYGDTGTGAASTIPGYATNTVVVRVTLEGDTDLDGDVDFNDFLTLQNFYNQTGTRFDQGNFNYDNVTDFNDFLALQNNYGQSIGFDGAAPKAVVVTAEQIAALDAFAAANAPVPEPASLAVLGLGAAGLLRRRR